MGNRFFWTSIFAIAVGNAFAIVRSDGKLDSDYVTLGNLFPAVGRLDYTSYSVTGVLINANTILTAGHNYPGANFVAPYLINGTSNSTKNWVRHPKYVGGESYDPQYDLSMSRLNTPVAGVTPASLFLGTSAAGQASWWCGFGSTGSPTAGSQGNTGFLRRACTNLLETWSAYPNTVAADFDDGTTPNNTLTNKRSPFSSPVPTSLEGIPGAGDSGGGIFVNVNGNYQLAGVIVVLFRYDGLSQMFKYGTVAGAASVVQHSHWIRAVSSPGGTVAGKIALQDLKGPVTSQRVRFQLVPAGNLNWVEFKDIVPDATGYFSWQTNLRGNYDLYALGATWLRKKIGTININDTWGSYAEGSLINGDANADNYVGTDDYIFVSGAFDTSLGEPGWDRRGDLDKDNYVGTDDYLILSSNLDSTGD